MKLRILVFVLVLSMLAEVHPAQGQKRQDTLPVLDGAAIFTDAVTILDTEPMVTLDWTNKTLYYLDRDATQWTSTKLPESFISSPVIARRSDGTYLVGNASIEFLMDFPGETMIFDPRTGIFSSPDRQCDKIKALPGEGKWILHAAKVGDLYVFCNTESGAQSPTLTETKRSVYCNTRFQGLVPSVLSPDGKVVIAALCRSEFEIALYAYDIGAKTSRLLGVIKSTGQTYDGALSIERWADATHPIIGVAAAFTDFMRFSRVPRDTLQNRIGMLLFADVTQANSLKSIVGTGNLRFGARLVRYFDAPPRYMWIPGENEKSTTPDCRLYEFDLKTLTTTSRESGVPGLCGLGMEIPNGNGDRLQIIKDVTRNRAQLVRFNFGTGKSEVLYTARTLYLQIVSISPGGSYGELADGDLNKLPEQNGIGGYMGNSDARLLVFDLRSKTVPVSAPYYISDPIVAPLLAPNLGWYEDGIFLLSGGTIYENWITQIAGTTIKSMPAERLYVAEGEPLPAEFPFADATPRVVITKDGGLAYLRPATKQSTPLVIPPKEGCCFHGKQINYQIIPILKGNGDISVTAMLIIPGEYLTLRRWTVRLR